jgi:hypothetical protein
MRLPGWTRSMKWFRDICDILDEQLANLNFNGHIDYSPKYVCYSDAGLSSKLVRYVTLNARVQQA